MPRLRLSLPILIAALTRAGSGHARSAPATTGIALPLATRPVLDSGELGAGPARFPAAANRDT